MKITDVRIETKTATLNLVGGNLTITQGGSRTGDPKIEVYIEKIDLPEFLQAVSFIASQVIWKNSNAKR